ncbi:hypothetical protein [Erythrobacter sp. Alg231-14]|uniref:hypothetical protein n=1 Tax=Erythrobacter sp. Alg231-14 TaxID=1922225 RepID=UPI000D54E5FE
MKLDKQFIQDRALRNSARAVIMADIEYARTSFSAKGVATRVGGRIGDGAKDVFEVAKTHSDDKRGIIALLIGAFLLWLAREPILEIVGLLNDDAFDDDSDISAETESEDTPEETGDGETGEPDADDVQDPAEPTPQPNPQPTPVSEKPSGDDDEQ